MGESGGWEGSMDRGESYMDQYNGWGGFETESSTSPQVHWEGQESPQGGQEDSMGEIEACDGLQAGSDGWDEPTGNSTGGSMGEPTGDSIGDSMGDSMPIN
jgi:hypothetical protein